MGFSVVQTAHGTGTSLSFSSNTTAGNLVIVVFGDTGSISAPSVSAMTLGGAAGNFASIAAVTNSRTLCTIWADPNCAGGQTAIAVTESNSSHPVIIAYEISGAALSSVLDKSSTSSGASTSWSSGTTVTTTNASEIWIGGVSVASAPTITPPGAFTNTNQVNGTSTALEAGFEIVSSTGTATYNGTFSASGTYAAVVVTLKPGNTTVDVSNAAVTIAAQGITPNVSVPISATTVTIAAQVISPVTGKFVNITASTVSIGASGLTPKVTVPISPATVSITASPITVKQTRKLILSIAAQAGVDQWANPYPAGFYCTTGQVDGNIIAQSTIQNGTLAQGAIDGYQVNALTVNSGVVSASDVIVSGTAGGLFAYSSGGTIVDTFTTSGTWKAPAGVTSIKVQCWGAGGGGGGTNSGLSPGGGAGGGEFAQESSVAVTPGTTYTYTVGAAGIGGGSSTSNGTNGGNSVFTGDSLTVTSHGGQAGKSAQNFGLGGLGGTGSTNTVHFDGGQGSSATSGNLGAGGSSGGINSAGNPGNGVTGQGGQAVTLGGPGGNIDSSPVSGYGGGGGGYGVSSGSDGWVGKIVITYTSNSPQLIASIAGLATSDPIASTSVPEGMASDHVSVNTNATTPSTPSGRCVLFYDGSALWALGPSGTAVKLATT